jgi:hypothetical protein
MNRKLDLEHCTTEAATILESAAAFGLTPDEILKTITTTLDCLPTDERAGYVDELAGALAKRLLEKQRRF